MDDKKDDHYVKLLDELEIHLSQIVDGPKEHAHPHVRVTLDILRERRAKYDL